MLNPNIQIPGKKKKEIKSIKCFKAKHEMLTICNNINQSSQQPVDKQNTSLFAPKQSNL